jgi:hypothetical protein
MLIPLPHIATWEDVVAIGGVASVFSVAAGVLATGYYNHSRERREARTAVATEKTTEEERADREADRLIKFLTEQRDAYDEALKAERLSFDEKLSDMRKCLERKIDELRARVDTYGCENAPTCKTRARLKRPPSEPRIDNPNPHGKAGGTTT